MAADATFHVFGTSHLAVLGITVLMAAIMSVLARRSSRYSRALEIGLGIAMLVSWPGRVLYGWYTHTLVWDIALPLFYCDVATFAGVAALWTHRRMACEIAYFFGLAGMLQGLITPALRIDFPAPEFWLFFLYHSGGVATALYVVIGLRMIPERGAVLRMFMLSLGYFAVASAVNALLGTNYGFFAAKPPSPSLMDYLGPWPWYLVSLLGVSWVYYFVLNLPFYRQQRANQAGQS